MAKRVCAEPGCPTLTDKTRCTTHTRAKDKARGTRQQRGYDATHDQLRATYQRRIDSGEVITCWRPGCWTVLHGRAWHLGHHDNRTHAGPECVPCNLRNAGIASHS
jgi:hypothetical protein